MSVLQVYEQSVQVVTCGKLGLLKLRKCVIAGFKSKTFNQNLD